MNNKKKPKMMWVHPEFHRQLKSESAELGMSIIDYTEEKTKKKKVNKNKPFEFGF